MTPHQDVALNRIDKDTFLSGVGQNASSRLAKMLSFVYGKKQNFDIRLAPNLEMRSECHLLGVAYPRFVYRVLLPEQNSFVDMRRLQHMADAIQEFSARPTYLMGDMLPGVEEDTKPFDAKTMIRRSRPIAGALLVPPQRLTESGYLILTTDIAHFHGENINAHGTPYMQPLAFGGGLCAQACMVTACLLQHQYVQNVLGVSELSVLARGANQLHAFEMKVSTLDLNDVSAVLTTREVGLFAPIESSYTTLPLDVFYSAIESYVNSCAPVLLSTFLPSLSEHVYSFNGDPDEHAPDNSNHLVVIVGVNAGSQEFLINDPNRLPFMRLPYSLLKSCEARRPLNGKDVDNCSTVIAEMPTIISVLPPDVKMTLLDVCEADAADRNTLHMARKGLVQIALNISKRSTNLVPTDRVNDSYYPAPVGTFLLVTLPELLDVLSGDVTRHGGGRFSGRVVDTLLLDEAIAEQIWAFIFSEPKFPKRLWVQLREHAPLNPVEKSVWIWDATTYCGIEAILRSGSHDVLHPNLKLCVRKTRSGECAPVYPVRKPESTLGVGLSASLLSSFEARSTGHVASHWPRSMSALEPYVLMKDDLPNATADAVEYLASIKCSTESLQTVANVCCLPGASAALRPIALSTYIPQISSLDNTERKQARDALIACGRIAEQIRRKSGSRTIVCEFVAGSRVDAVWRRISMLTQSAFCASIGDDSVVMDRVFQVLSEVVKEVPSSVVYAVELEPGFLNLINDFRSLEEFCKRVEKYHLGSRIGVNLDVSHFRLAGLTAKKIRESELIRNMIVHAHVSGVWAKGHASDLPIFPTDKREMTPWIQLLADISKARSSQLRQKSLISKLAPYSGFVSVELEACNSSKDVFQSLKNLRKMIAETE